MATNITVRLPWHMNGWNGTVCADPRANTFCAGRHSYPADMIAKTKDDEYEVGCAGKHCGELETPPPCAMSCNAFGSETIRCFYEPPEWWADGARTSWADVPPYTVNIWPYELMYADEITVRAGQGQSFNNDTRREAAQRYFFQLTPGETILIYYANYSNPFSDETKQRYIVVGIALLSEVGNEMFYDDVSDRIARKYAKGLVWQRPLTSSYPEQGMRIPYERYYDKPDVLMKIVIEPDNPRAFKYATREISDDDLITLIERLIGVTNYLTEIDDTTQNWQSRKEWLVGLLSGLWRNRGAYPGFPQVLNYLACTELAQEYLDECRKGNSVDGYNSIKEKLLSDGEVNRTIKLKGEDKQILLLDVLPRFNLTKEQVPALVDEAGAKNGITASATDIIKNPYILCEQYIGNNPDDVISFYQIDNGALPSPEYDVKALTAKNSAKRFRALCVDALRWDNTHTFSPSERILDLVNHRVGQMSEWRRNNFGVNYFDVDRDTLEEAVTFRTDNKNNRIYLYLKEVYEDERLIECTLRKLAERRDIELRQPVTSEQFCSLLSTSPEMSKLSATPEYAQAIKKQSRVCAGLFRKSLCVLSGAAGTGKTSIVIKIIKKLMQTEGRGVSIKLLAPTGKAADRIREKIRAEDIEVQVATIHSFIASHGWLNRNMSFKREGGVSDTDVNTVIIDEASMVDLSLFATLFRAIHWNNVRRLILVGDQNQLPPIGRGKVFSDIIEWLSKEYHNNVGELKDNIRQMENRVNKRGTGIVELAEILIQEKQIKQIDDTLRNDILQIISEEDGDDSKIDKNQCADLLQIIKEPVISDSLRGEIQQIIKEVNEDDTNSRIQCERIRRLIQKPGIKKAQREEILRKIQEGDKIDEDLFVRYWKTADELDDFIESELGIDLGVSENGGGLSERWIESCKIPGKDYDKNPAKLQVISPFRGEDYGTDRLNSTLQNLLNGVWSNKFSLEGITLYDKVMQCVNRPRSNQIYAYNWTNKQNEQVEIFNGDMGFTHRHNFDKNYTNILKRFSVKFLGKEQFSVGYGRELGYDNGRRLLPEEKPINNLELAYAISVHKSQGSEFDTVYLVIPKRRSSTLSMELLYTAVTRAKCKLVLFIQEDISTLSSLTKIERSAVQRINSSVFNFKPLPEQLSYLPAYYEEYKVIATLEDYFVRSKSEALIANALHTSDLDFSYEKPLFAPDGTMYLPDFTIKFQGDEYYWEHWGLLDKSKYKAHTDYKIKWYREHFPCRLIESFERNDISKQIREICLKHFDINL